MCSQRVNLAPGLGEMRVALLRLPGYVLAEIKNRNASNEPMSVCLVLDVFSHGFPRKCLFHRYQEFVVFERAAVC